MITDRPPRKLEHCEEFLKSDQLTSLPTPDDERLRLPARRIEEVMEAEELARITDACSVFIATASKFYQVREPHIRILAARPLRVREGRWTMELFGDYAPSTLTIRVWMRTAVVKKVTSFGTFFSTLCHEFCHHLDCQRFGLNRSPHTRGFYQRAAVLYHHARGTAIRRLVWSKAPGNRWRINWPAMKRAAEDERISIRR